MRLGGQARRASISGILGIHLTQVTPTSSVSERGGLPSNARGVRGPLRHRRSLSGLSREAALADGVYLSTLRAHPRLARAHGVVAVRELRSPNFGHGGHHLRRHARPPDDVVPGDVVRDQSEDRDQRPELAAGLGPAELSDRLGVAAHAAPGHGAPRAGSARRAGRGRRDLGGRAASRGPRAGPLRATDSAWPASMRHHNMLGLPERCGYPVSGIFEPTRRRFSAPLTGCSAGRMYRNIELRTLAPHGRHRR